MGNGRSALETCNGNDRRENCVGQAFNGITGPGTTMLRKLFIIWCIWPVNDPGLERRSSHKATNKQVSRPG